jgi:hypothetical protein
VETTRGLVILWEQCHGNVLRIGNYTNPFRSTAFWIYCRHWEQDWKIHRRAVKSWAKLQEELSGNATEEWTGLVIRRLNLVAKSVHSNDELCRSPNKMVSIIRYWNVKLTDLHQTCSHENLTQRYAFKINNFSNTNIGNLRKKSSTNASRSMAGQTLRRQQDALLLVKYRVEKNILTFNWHHSRQWRSWFVNL